MFFTEIQTVFINYKFIYSWLIKMKNINKNRQVQNCKNNVDNKTSKSRVK